MKILMLHNQYQQLGGEDLSTQNEAKLLRDHGHEVDLVLYDNKKIQNMSKLAIAAKSIWSREAHHDISQRLNTKQYDLLHVQNYFSLVSPAVHHAAFEARVPSIQALRNYRLMCANAQLHRENSTCEKCIGKYAPFAGVIHRCYRDSLAASSAVAAMIATHRALGTWNNKIAGYIAVSEHVKQKYIDGGFPRDKLYAKPNVVSNSPITRHAPRKKQICYVGRLSPEKGCDQLLKAWSLAKTEKASLVIAGDGPDRERLKSLSQADPSVNFIGKIDPGSVNKLMAESQAIVIPSTWGEPFPRTGVEAFSNGTPVFGAASGGISELFPEGKGGRTYDAHDYYGLSKLITRLFADEEWSKSMQDEAQILFKTLFSPQATLHKTLQIYTDVCEKYKGQRKI